MSENVKVPFGKGGDNAVLLLAAAEELELEASVVRTSTHGFEVPKEVADKAGVDTYDPDEEFRAEVDEARKAVEERPEQDMSLSRSGYDEQDGNTDPAAEEPKATKKKAPAKKAAAKKSTGKES